MSLNDNNQYNRDFVYSIPSKVLFHPDLTFLQKQIYAIIRSFMDTTGDAYPSNNWIARLCGVERNAVIVGLNALIEKNLIQRVMIEGRRHLIVTQSPIPMQPLLEASTSIPTNTPPSIPTNTPPSIPRNTQLDQSNIRSNKDNILSSGEDTQKKYKASDYEKDVRFMRFYMSYPIRKKGAHAYKMWLRLNPDEDMLEMMMNDVQERLTNDSQWMDGCIPHPGTYLNPECPGFKDEIVNREKIKHEAKKSREAQRQEADKKLQDERALASQRAADFERENNKNKVSSAKSSKNIQNLNRKPPPKLGDILKGL